jgi:vancomycin permeability regulator SanA
MPSLRPAAACAIVFLLVANAQAERRAIVVLGTAVRPDGRPGSALERRLETALALARADRSALVVVSGGAVANGFAEGPAMARWLAARGLPRRRIRVESEARNTRENADLSLPLLRRARVDRVTVVTERYHLPRGLFHLRAALREQGLARVAVDGAAAPDLLAGADLTRRARKERWALLRDSLIRLVDVRSPRGAAALRLGVRLGLVRVEGGGATQARARAQDRRPGLGPPR